MSWNYRVIRENDLLRVAEVYYDDNGMPEAWTLPDFDPLAGWEELSELKGTVDHIADAFEKPVLHCNGEQLVEEE